MLELIVSCEHASNHVPPELASRFRSAAARRALDGHRGFDPGALPLARALASALAAPLYATTVSRLVVEVNRSAHHPKLFSSFTEGLDPALKRRVLARYYRPHRLRVEAAIGARIERGAQVLHLGVHSFAPVLGGVRRDADIGLLYDPAREGERLLCGELQRVLGRLGPTLRVRRNYPYRGSDDGLTTHLRRVFPEGYLGIELEVNQRIAREQRARRALLALLARALPQVLSA